MKGIIIYGSPEGAITFCEFVNEASYELKNYYGSQEFASCLKGEASKVSKAKCSPEDTYDFETGALISLMKMCLFDKSYKAIEEAFRYNSYNNKKNNEYEKKIDALEKENSHLKYVISCKESAIESLENTRNLLIEKNNEVTTDREKTWKIYQNALQIIQEKQDRIIKLKEENKKLKLDCEKLQHGYIDTDMIFCGGRQNGKQHTALVNMFKKLDQKKVDAAYKEAYNTNLPLWQKEVLKQMYEIHEESKEKTIKRNDQLDSLIEGNKYADKWTKPPTKREEMWAEIFELHKESDVIIKVKKEDVNAFLHEIENKIPEITWFSTVKIFETKYTIGDVYEELKTRDMIYFRLWKDNRLSYSSDPHVYPYRELKKIPYLPPMRWDLFKKGRLVVKVDTDNYEDFYNKCEKEIGRKPHYSCKGTFTVYYSKGTFHRRPYDEKIPYKHRVVNWEDVR